ncbi:PadR family transcriptional regulator [Candidatus Mycobacterium methanotrophicum]|uniref:PadR family transcriptional regulator n=1 Tax=Candidatus Mycobacterium methanotrophicum TaxID=2943498 RepID=A0ABY4QIA8_9MYCO|nr:helix-turn-helix transcriptional regulator [Candidatus Mycobacterium methanotrophicum]UQX09415.1 PadR family transcriptional regulator [Candidatus Mycobacterium methanotrophicum]
MISFNDIVDRYVGGAEHGYKISPGALYPMLHRMQEEGLLTSRQEVVDGRARRAYEITDLERAALLEECTALAELASEILGHQGGDNNRAPDTGTPRRRRRRGSDGAGIHVFEHTFEYATAVRHEPMLYE